MSNEFWGHFHFADVCYVVSGKNQSAVVNPNGKYPIYGSGGIIGHADNYICDEGTTIIGRKGTINSPIYVPTKFWNVDTAFGLSAKTEVLEKKFLFYFCVSFNFKSLDKSTAVPSLAKGDINKIEFPIPPLPEQRAIVSKIEQLFSALDNGTANLKKAQAQLKVYRQAVLSSIVNGSTLVPINEVVQDLTQGWSPSCINRSSSDPEEWAVIKTSAVQHGRYIDVENKILPEILEPREQHEIEVGDILITRAGPRVRVGVCCLVRKTRPRLINCDKVYRIRVNSDLMHPEFFEAVMNSPEYMKAIEKIKTGSSDSGLNLTQNRFLTIEIPLPTLEEQHQIVQEIETRLSVCDKLEESIKESLQKSEALRKSILKRAFAGQLLTEEELAACRQEKDWKPAGVLLERVRKDKNRKTGTKYGFKG